MRILAIVAALFAAVPVLAQAPPPRLELPAPSKPAPPGPTTAYNAPPPSRWVTPLLYSQIALAGAGTGQSVARHANGQDSTPAAVTAVGVVGLAILLERAYDHEMKPGARKWVSIANFAAAGVLSGFAARDVRQARRKVQTANAP